MTRLDQKLALIPGTLFVRSSLSKPYEGGMSRSMEEVHWKRGDTLVGVMKGGMRG
jgi:hypothetical protein